MAVIVAAFLLPVITGGLAWYSGRDLHQNWITAAMILIAVTALAFRPLPLAAAGASLATAGVSWSWSLRTVRRPSWRVRRQMRAFRRELAPLGRVDLEYTAAADPYPGDKRVA